MYPKVIAELERISGLIGGEIASIIDRITCKDNALKKRIAFSAGDIGFKLRPYLVIKGAAIGDVSESIAIPFAAGVELLQLSTLVIDDILDDSAKRNNADSCVKKYGIKESILIGEYLHNLSIKHILSLCNIASIEKLINIIGLLSDSYQAITVGQFYDLQTSSLAKPLQETEALDLINLTTGIFIKNSLLIGAVLGDMQKDIVKALSDYGYYLGVAYQLRDDIIDIIGEEIMTGKPMLIDIKNKRYRIPIIFFLANGSSGQKKAFGKIIRKRNKTKRDKLELINILKGSSAISYSIKKTSELCEKAKHQISSLPESEIKSELLALPDIIANFDN